MRGKSLEQIMKAMGSHKIRVRHAHSLKDFFCMSLIKNDTWVLAVEVGQWRNIHLPMDSKEYTCLSTKEEVEAMGSRTIADIITALRAVHDG